MTTFLDKTHQKHGSHSYAAGYLGSLASNMVYEMRVRGQHEMADHYERQLTHALKEMQ
jgi:hypothetical protein